jgi:hypothetical protein
LQAARQQRLSLSFSLSLSLPFQNSNEFPVLLRFLLCSRNNILLENSRMQEAKKDSIFGGLASGAPVGADRFPFDPREYSPAMSSDSRELLGIDPPELIFPCAFSCPENFFLGVF